MFRSKILPIRLLYLCLLYDRIQGRTPDFSPSAYQYPTKTAATSSSSIEIDLGTTLVAIKYSEGVVVGADTRTSTGGYVSNKFAFKINPILAPSSASSPSSSLSSCVLCRSGSAADTQWLAGRAKETFLSRKLQRPGYSPTISNVAHYIRHCVRSSNSDSSRQQQQQEPLQASLICAGYDVTTKQGQIYAITPGGSLLEEDYFCVSGSGSTILLGYLDSLDMNIVSTTYTKEEAVKLVTKLLQLSMARDGSSGGFARIIAINEEGLDEVVVYSDPSKGEGKSSNQLKELEGFANIPNDNGAPGLVT